MTLITAKMLDSRGIVLEGYAEKVETITVTTSTVAIPVPRGGKNWVRLLLNHSPSVSISLPLIHDPASVLVHNLVIDVINLVEGTIHIFVPPSGESIHFNDLASAPAPNLLINKLNRYSFIKLASSQDIQADLVFRQA